MRRALILGAAAVLVAGAGFLALRTGGGAKAPGGSSLQTRSAVAGGVEVTVEPLAVDGSGAVFRVTFDTHSVDVDLDPAGGSGLRVSGRAWGPVTWEGDGPGGHHRGGRLRFAPGGPVGGDLRLTIEGLPEPVELTWRLGAVER